MGISELDCRKIQDWCVDGSTLVKYVAEYFDVSERTIRKHANGECTHSHGFPDEIKKYEKMDANGEWPPNN